MNFFGKRILVLIPHPDDEVVGVAAACARAKAAGARLYGIYLSHGCLARQTLWPWQRAAYEKIVAQRWHEAAAAAAFLGLHIVGPKPSRSAREIWPQLEAVRADVLVAIQQCAPDQLWVPAYEGGNPDHDGVNALGTTFSDLSVYEYAEYHAAGGLVQSNNFIDKRGDEVVITLSGAEQRMKRDALRLYASEQKNLGSITCVEEMLRPLKPYDYSHPPHDGTLGYARFAWVPFRHPRVDFTKPRVVSAALMQFLQRYLIS